MKTFTQRKLSGSQKNPVIGASQSYRSGLRVVNLLGRGRKVFSRFSTVGDDVLVEMEFQNHNKERGWTLANVVEILDGDGQTIAVVSDQKGLKPKGWRGYRVRRHKETVKNVAKSASHVRVMSYRNRTGRFVKEAVEDVILVVRAYYGDAAAAKKLGAEILDQFGLGAKPKPKASGGSGRVIDNQGVFVPN